MTEDTKAPGLSTIQAAVQIVQNITQCGCHGAHYERQVEDLHALMADWSLREVRTNSAYTLAAEKMTVEDITHEDIENTPLAEAYWAATSAFFRKVYQACAAAA